MTDRLVWLQRGMAVPLDAVELLLDCERAGIRLEPDGAKGLRAIGPMSPETLEQLRRRKDHLLMLLRYMPDDRHLHDSSLPAPDLGPLVVRRNA